MWRGLPENTGGAEFMEVGREMEKEEEKGRRTEKVLEGRCPNAGTCS